MSCIYLYWSWPDPFWLFPRDQWLLFLNLTVLSAQNISDLPLLWRCGQTAGGVSGLRGRGGPPSSLQDEGSEEPTPALVLCSSSLLPRAYTTAGGVPVLSVLSAGVSFPPPLHVQPGGDLLLLSVQQSSAGVRGRQHSDLAALRVRHLLQQRGPGTDLALLWPSTSCDHLR